MRPEDLGRLAQDVFIDLDRCLGHALMISPLDRGWARKECPTRIYDRRRQNFDRHAAYVVVAFLTGG
jgi:hypothetical protein